MEQNSDMPKSITIEEAVAERKKVAALSGHCYSSDEEALFDFMTIHWAWKGEIMDAWFEKLNECGCLEKGWNGYDADPPSPVASINAWKFLEICGEFDLEPFKLTPTVMGGIAMRFKTSKDSYFLEFYNNGTTWMMHSTDGYEVRTSEITNFKQCVIKIKDQ